MAERPAVTGSKPGIVLDARAMLDGRPVVLREVGGRSLLFHHLEAARRAKVLDRTVVVAADGWAPQMRELLSQHERYRGVVVEEQGQHEGMGVVLPGDALYIPHLLSKALRKGKRDFSRVRLCVIASLSDVEKAEAFVWRAENLPLARYVNMPVARRLAFLLARTPVTPNQVTVAAGLTGVGAGLAMAVGSYWWDLVAAVLIQVAWTLDLTDGYLARITNRSSVFGAWLDTIQDEIKNMAMYLGLTFGVMRSSGSLLWLWVGAAWVLSYHVAAISFRYDQASGGPQQWASEPGGTGAGSLGRRLRAALRRVFAVSRSIDALPQLFTLALVTNLKVVLLVFLAATSGVSLAGLLAARWAAHRRATAIGAAPSSTSKGDV